MASRQGAKAANAVAVAAARDNKIVKIASSIINPDNQVRLKSLINRNNKKDACSWRDPRFQLTLLQIAGIADNASAGTLPALLLH